MDDITNLLIGPQEPKKAAPQTVEAPYVSPVQKVINDALAKNKPAPKPAPKPPAPKPPAKGVQKSSSKVIELSPLQQKNIMGVIGGPVQKQTPAQEAQSKAHEENKARRLSHLMFTPEQYRKAIANEDRYILTPNGISIPIDKATKQYVNAVHEPYHGFNVGESQTDINERKDREQEASLAPNVWKFKPNESIPTQAMQRAKSFVGGLSQQSTDRLGQVLFGAREGWFSLDPESEDSRRGQDAIANLASMFIPGLNALQGAETAGNTIQTAKEQGGAKAGTDLIKGLIQSMNPTEAGLTPTERIVRTINGVAGLFGAAHGATHLAAALDRLHPKVNIDLGSAVKGNEHLLPDEYQPKVSKQAGAINPRPLRPKIKPGEVPTKENLIPKVPKTPTPEGVNPVPGYTPGTGIKKLGKSIKNLGGANVGGISAKATERADVLRSKQGEIESNSFRNNELFKHAKQYFDQTGAKNFKDKYPEGVSGPRKLDADVDQLINATEKNDPDYFEKRAIHKVGSEAWNSMTKDKQKSTIDKLRKEVKPDFVDKLKKITNYESFDQIESPEKLDQLREDVNGYDQTTKDAIKEINDIKSQGLKGRLHSKKLNDLMSQYGDEYHKSKLLEYGDDVMRPVIEKYGKRLEELGKLDTNAETFNKNYYSHSWENPDAYTEFANKSNEDLAKRNLGAKSGFLKKRTIPTYAEGIRDSEGNLTGNIPKYANPIEGQLHKLASMDRYLTGQKMLKRDIDTGNVQYLPEHGKMPQGYDHVPDELYDVNGNKPKYIQEYYDKGMREGLHNLADTLGVDVKSVPGFKDRGKFGEAEPGKVTTRGPYEGLLMHEIGHTMDDKFNLQGKLLKDKDISDELDKLSEFRYREGDKVSDSFKEYTKDPSEKVANLIHAVVHTPELVQSVAPKAYEKLNGILNKTGGIKGGKAVANAFRDLSPSLEIGRESTQIKGPTQRLGRYIMPSDQSAVVDKFLSSGLSKNEAFKTFRNNTGFINGVNLGLSGRHAVVTALQSAFHDIGLGTREVVDSVFNKGKGLGKGLYKVGRGVTPFASVKSDMKVGKQLRDEYLKNLDLPDEQKSVLNGVLQSNLGLGRDPFYNTDFSKTVKEAFNKDAMDKILHGPTRAKTLGNMAHAIPSTFASITEPLSHVIMHTIVPQAKLGAFSKIFTHELELHQANLDKFNEKYGTNKELSPEEFKRIASDTANAIENTFGELRYSSLLLDNKFKDVLLGTFRATGYNLGTARVIGRVPMEFGSTVGRIAKGINEKTGLTEKLNIGKPPENPFKGIDRSDPQQVKEALGKFLEGSENKYKSARYAHNFAYAWGLIFGSYVYSTMLQNAYNGYDAMANKKPMKWQIPGFTNGEFLKQKTPFKDEKGQDIYTTLPTYARDFMGFLHDPKGEISAKLSEPVQMASELLGNKTYSGQKIFEEQDNPISALLHRGKKLAGYGLEHAAPFTISNIGKPGNSLPVDFLSLFGVNKAPAYMQSSPAEDLASKFVGQRMPAEGRTQAEMDKSQDRKQFINRLREAQGKPEELQKIMKEAGGKYTDSQIDKMFNESKRTKIQGLIQYLSLPQAIEVMKVAKGDPNDSKSELGSLKEQIWNKLDSADDRNTYSANDIKKYIAAIKKAYGIK